MYQLLYLEIPTPAVTAVKTWLQQTYAAPLGQTQATAHGILWENHSHNPIANSIAGQTTGQVSVFVWTLQRTTYLKAFRWTENPPADEAKFIQDLTAAIRNAFPYHYPQLPELEGNDIFTALADIYPLTVQYFQQMPNGAYDLQRAYWWEKRWRENVKNPQAPAQVVFDAATINITQAAQTEAKPEYDIIYLGGALGAIHAAMMAKLGYRVCVVERIPFGRMNREWNISRKEFQNLIDFGLFTEAEFASMITAEYADGFNKFFDGNNPPHLKSAVLRTPTVLNIAINTSRILEVCGAKLAEYGATILDETEFQKVVVDPDRVTVYGNHLPTQTERVITGRLIIDAMGSASRIAQQINGGQAFDSVCPTVGAVVEGFDRGVWDQRYGDVLFTHGDISRGRQLIWELFPGEGDEVAIYLFHYHQIHPENPGSLLDMYEDFFTILPEYRRCDVQQLKWKKPTFGYITGQYSLGETSRQCAFDRILAIGDAAALQSPLVFTGFGSLVRNLPRLTTILDTALKHDLLKATDLNQINAYQSNVAVTWLFSKGMMVPTGKHLPPERINSMLNTFFGVLAEQPEPVADRFIKDKLTWWMFNRLAIIAAIKNPLLVVWIWEMAGTKDMLRWLLSYFAFTRASLVQTLAGQWLPQWLRSTQTWLEPQNPRLWLKLLIWSYGVNYSLGQTK